jgi:hypothetical protein
MYLVSLLQLHVLTFWTSSLFLMTKKHIVPPPKPYSFRILRLFTAIFFLFLLPFQRTLGEGEPCLLVPVPLEQRTQAAAVIAEGQVISQRSFWDEAHHNIYTASTIAVYKLFKGSLEETFVEVITEGGQVGDTRHVFSSTLRLRLGQQGVFFLKPSRQRGAGISTNNRPLFEVYSSLQGFIRYDLQTKIAQDPFQIYSSIPADLYSTLRQTIGTEHRVVQPNPAVLTLPEPKESGTTAVEDVKAIPAVTSFSPVNIQAGTGQILTINGLNFGTSRGQGTVGFRNADDGGRTFILPLATDYVSWSDTQIRVRVPSNGLDGGTAGTGQIQITNNAGSQIISTGSLTVIFAYSNLEHEGRSYIPDMVNQNGAGGYTFRFSPSFQGNLAARTAFSRSMDQWVCSTTVNWTIGQPTTATASAEDNMNTVRFDVGPELPTGTLGRTISRYRGCGFVGGDLNWYVTEVDMEFDDGANWQFGPARPGPLQFDFESIVLHELGHAHQLSHIILPRAVMHFGAARAQVNRELNPENDIAGAQTVMTVSLRPNICGPTPMIPIPTISCRLPVTFITFQARFVAGTGVVLNWETEAEVNSAFFIVERSPNASDWTEIGRVPGAGNSLGMRQYQFIDTNPLAGISFYRLRVTNTTNEYGVSQVVQVINREVEGLALFPNPVQNQTVQGAFFSNIPDGTITLRIHDSAGQHVHTLSLMLHQGMNFLNISLPNLSRGLYHIRWDDGTTTGSSKLVKL